jgi:enamine deaminase RidA (YjgF/YER057c/UK114 family)
MSMPSNRQLISNNSVWEASIGYSRAVKVGNMVFVSGTTALDSAGQVVAPGDTYGQTQFALRKIEAALKEAGSSLNDVVRTRVFITNIDDWEAAARAHGEVFHTIRPACAMIGVSRFINPAHLVEIEVDAVIAE